MKEIESVFAAIGIGTTVIVIGGALLYILWFFKEIWPHFEENYDDFKKSTKEMQNLILDRLRELEEKVEFQRPASRAEKSD